MEGFTKDVQLGEVKSKEVQDIIIINIIIIIIIIIIISWRSTTLTYPSLHKGACVMLVHYAAIGTVNISLTS